MTRSEKETLITEVADKVSRASALYFTDFTGLTVAEASELRREFRKSGIEYTVVKNTLIRKALERVTGFDTVHEKLVGPTAIAFSYDDAIAPAKVMKKFSEKTGKVSLKIAVVERQVFDGNRLDELALLPSRTDLIASILGSIQAPISGIAGAIGALMRDLVGLVDAIEKQKATQS
jgi:large subunit ribosomal protein L10